MTCDTQDITIRKGSTFILTARWETTPLVYKAVTAITKAAPPVLTVASHGIPDQWRGAVISALGMSEINAEDWPLRESDLHKITVVDSNTININDVNAAEYSTYTSGGYLVYRTPVDLNGFTARMQIRESDTSTGTPLVDLVSPTNIVLDNTVKTVTVTISATATAAYTFSSGVYDLELVSGTGVVTALLAGAVLVEEEVTR